MGIRLELGAYCQECPEFEVDVDKTFTRVGCEVIKNNTVICCKHRKRCMEIAKYLHSRKD